MKKIKKRIRSNNQVRIPLLQKSRLEELEKNVLASLEDLDSLRDFIDDLTRDLEGTAANLRSIIYFPNDEE